MKKLFPFMCLSMIVLLNACSSDLKVGADYKDYTVVFGLLSRNDTAHYIKITKGFYDEKQNNLLVAQVADSLYYNNLEVKFYILNNSNNIVDSALLNRVDLNLEGYQKDSGIFVNTPNYAYKYKLAYDSLRLDPTKTYKLSVKNLTTGKIVYGETNVIDNTKMKITYPLADQQEMLDFAKIGISSTNFIWNSPATVSIYDLYLKLGYEEKNNINLVTTYKTVLVPLQKNILNNNSPMNVQITALDFYNALQSSMSAAPSYITRYIDTPDVMVAGAGSELKTYIDVTNAQGGITYDQIKPYYTNMKGGEVLGLLSTRASSYSYQVKFSKSTYDSILNGSSTKSLNFVGKSSK